MKKRYGVAEARARFATVLNEAERGTEVLIERSGVQFRLQACPTRTRARARSPLIEHADPAILDGTWTWRWHGGRLRLNTRRRGLR